MMLLLALAATLPVTAPPRRQATGTVRVLRSASASAADWASAPKVHRREIVVREKDGRLTPVRLIEHE